MGWTRGKYAPSDAFRDVALCVNRVHAAAADLPASGVQSGWRRLLMPLVLPSRLFLPR